jgi:hypothetical protein
MKKIDRLKREANTAAAERGHKMHSFAMITAHRAASNCELCGLRAYVDDAVEAGFVDKFGPALAMQCAAPAEADPIGTAAEHFKRELKDAADLIHPIFQRELRDAAGLLRMAR